MIGFEKDTVYYRADIRYRSGVETSAYLGEDNPDIKKVVMELKNFIEDSDAKSFDITRHEAKKGDGLAHIAGVEIRLVRKNNKIYVDGGQNG